MAQRVVQYQAVFELSKSAPQIYDLPQLHRQMIEVLGVKNADKIVPLSDDAKPADPVSENMAALVGKPMQAFIYQDHEAHIATLTSFMQDPMIAQTIGQNPMAQQIMGSMQAHIAEHLGFLYRKQLEERLGVMLPAPNEEMPEEIEIQLSRLVADAGKQLTQAHQQQAAQQQAAAQAEDPMFQLQKGELEVKASEVERKAKKDADDLRIAEEKLQLERDKAGLQAYTAKQQRDSQERQNKDRTKLDLTKTVIAASKPQPKPTGKK
jgi:hypothetical protein